MILTILIIIPLIGSFIIITLNDTEKIKQYTLFFTILTFFWSILIWSLFDNNVIGYQFLKEYNNTALCHIVLGIDGLSLFFVLLTTFTIPITILASWESIKNAVKEYMYFILLLEFFLLTVFVVIDIILFYIFFEAVLIPLFFIIGIWGSGTARVRATFLLFLYTLGGSLLMLLSFISLYALVGSTDIELLSINDLNYKYQYVLWVPIFISLAIKTPLLPFTLWLSRAHVESPLGGSIVLAGLILKLATYGYLRILIPILPEGTAFFGPVVQIVCLVTIIYSSLTTIRQTDFKCLVAYSSVAHIAVVTAGLFSNNLQGIEGGIFLSLSHGFTSPALFMLVGGILYDSHHTRSIEYYRGIVFTIPLFATIFFVFTLANMSTPLTGNWIGEVLTLIGMYLGSPIVSIFISSGIIFSSIYSIWLFNRLTFGKSSTFLNGELTTDVNRREYNILISLLIPIVIVGLWPNIILSSLHISVSTLLY